MSIKERKKRKRKTEKKETNKQTKYVCFHGPHQKLAMNVNKTLRNTQNTQKHRRII